MQEFCVEIALHTAQYNLKFDNFPGKLWSKFDTIFFVYYSRFACVKDRRLHCHVNDIRNRNVLFQIFLSCQFKKILSNFCDPHPANEGSYTKTTSK